MINPVSLYQKLKPYRVTNDADLPAAYRQGSGRELHGDWVIFKNVKRIDTAYKVPMPFKKLRGNQVPHLIPYQEGYPLVPGTDVVNAYYWDGTRSILMPHIMAYDPVPEVGQWGVYAAYLNGEWVECFRTATYPFKYFGYNRWVSYFGLKSDLTLGDWMAWLWEISEGPRR